MKTEAVERLGRARPGGVVYTCEHASNRVPRGHRVDTPTRALLRDHWGYDIGAAWVTRALARVEDSAAVLGRTSRLVLDVNRAPDDASLIVAHTHDGAVSFNGAVSAGEHAARVARWHTPFHEAVDAAMAAAPARLLFSVHSFTPVWRGTPREVEAGVLFDRHDDLAERLVETLRGEGFRTEPNEPYSGKVGLIYSAARHGTRYGIPYLEIELRQDLVRTRPLAEAVAARVRRALLASGA